jgi:hypothetical protein
MKWLFVVILMCGCATQKVVVSHVDGVSCVPTAIPTIARAVNRLYTVIEGDCLWSISKREYGDAFMWPLILHDNREKIEEQDLIYAGQNFVIETQVLDEDRILARSVASDTPEYHGHKH